MRAGLILDNLSTSTVLLEPDGTVVDLNPAAENLLGVSRRRACGRNIVSFFPHETEQLQLLMEGARQNDQAYGQDLTLTPGPHYPESRIVDCRVTPVLDQPQPKLIIEFADITRRIRLHRENALLQQHGASRKMIRQLAHEIKNPLGGLRGAAQLLARQLTSAELTRYTDVIIAEADRLAALVDTLLGPGGRSEKTPQNVHVMLEHVAQLLEAEAGSELRIRREYDAGLPWMALDRDQMLQAFLNVARNAMQASERDGELVIRTSALTNFTIGDTRHKVIANIAIEDFGCGIPDELRDSIFFPLVTGRDGGTGLGLPLAQELVSRHGGLIEFESRPGHTVFHIRLPLKDRDDATAA